MPMNLHIICLTKSYNKLDFDLWLKYYKSLGACVHIIDNESSIDIDSSSWSQVGDSYERIEGWPNQWKLFDDILNQNWYGFQYGDYIIFADDDEYFWFNGDAKTVINNEFKRTQLDLLCVPQIYISSQKLEKQRSGPYVLDNYYIRHDFSSQGKAVIYYNPNMKYCFSKNNKEIGHIPFLKYPGSKEWIRMAKVIGSDITKDSTYGITDHKANLRLYHYHLKSIDDWNKKWARGSAACDNQPYSEDFHNNPGFDGYDSIDLTIKNYFKYNLQIG